MAKYARNFGVEAETIGRDGIKIRTFAVLADEWTDAVSYVRWLFRDEDLPCKPVPLQAGWTKRAAEIDDRVAEVFEDRIFQEGDSPS